VPATSEESYFEKIAGQLSLKIQTDSDSSTPSNAPNYKSFGFPDPPKEPSKGFFSSFMEQKPAKEEASKPAEPESVPQSSKGGIFSFGQSKKDEAKPEDTFAAPPAPASEEISAEEKPKGKSGFFSFGGGKKAAPKIEEAVTAVPQQEAPVPGETAAKPPLFLRMPDPKKDAPAEPEQALQPSKPSPFSFSMPKTADDDSGESKSPLSFSFPSPKKYEPAAPAETKPSPFSFSMPKKEEAPAAAESQPSPFSLSLPQKQDAPSAAESETKASRFSFFSAPKSEEEVLPSTSFKVEPPALPKLEKSLAPAPTKPENAKLLEEDEEEAPAPFKLDFAAPLIERKTEGKPFSFGLPKKEEAVSIDDKAEEAKPSLPFSSPKKGDAAPSEAGKFSLPFSLPNKEEPKAAEESKPSLPFSFPKREGPKPLAPLELPKPVPSPEPVLPNNDIAASKDDGPLPNAAPAPTPAKPTPPPPPPSGKERAPMFQSTPAPASGPEEASTPWWEQTEPLVPVVRAIAQQHS
jgi:hypothetical protein